jgi:hypothetical protein
MAESTLSGDNVICPYCGEEQSDSWESVDETPDQQDCQSCEKTFTCWAEREVTYHAAPIKADAEKGSLSDTSDDSA